MKDQRSKPNTVRSENSSGKIHTLYRELLDLREEVRDAEKRGPQKVSKGQKAPRKGDRKFPH
jgi:hypothetical protein